MNNDTVENDCLFGVGEMIRKSATKIVKRYEGNWPELLTTKLSYSQEKYPPIMKVWREMKGECHEQSIRGS